MQYLLLIYSNEKNEPAPGTPAGDAHLNAYMKFTEDVQQAKLMRGANALQEVSTATTVRVRDGKTLTTDGPFVAIKEALGGYLFFEADDLDAAIELAARIPAARMGGAIEVRPLV